ncbi:MAG: metallophosphoesterase [Eubacterium sp.]|nr:metallophosphoesterase [Eubacterium sp.]
MGVILAGDTHATLDLNKVVRYFDEQIATGREFSEEDYLIILGDVGICGFSKESETTTRRILRRLPVTVLFIDGNHENFEELYSYPVEEWHGGKVHVIEDHMLHLMRGQIFDIDGKRFFTFGGAYSIDRLWRSPGIDWFEEEMPSDEEYKEGLANLEKADWEVDYVLSHTGPEEAIDQMGYAPNGLGEDEMVLRRYFQQIAEKLNFKAWYFGHFHEDIDVDDMFFCLFETMVELEDK